MCRRTWSPWHLLEELSSLHSQSQATLHSIRHLHGERGVRMGRVNDARLQMALGQGQGQGELLQLLHHASADVASHVQHHALPAVLAIDLTFAVVNN